MTICKRCNKPTVDHTDGICEDCWDWAEKYLEETGW